MDPDADPNPQHCLQGSILSLHASIGSVVHDSILTWMRIRIQLQKTICIRIRNPTRKVAISSTKTLPKQHICVTAHEHPVPGEPAPWRVGERRRPAAGSGQPGTRGSRPGARSSCTPPAPPAQMPHISDGATNDQCSGSVCFWACRIRIRQRERYGSGSFHHQAKLVRKTLILHLYDFLSLKNAVNVPLKNNQKNLGKIFFFGVLKVTDEGQR